MIGVLFVILSMTRQCNAMLGGILISEQGLCPSFVGGIPLPKINNQKWNIQNIDKTCVVRAGVKCGQYVDSPAVVGFLDQSYTATVVSN